MGYSEHDQTAVHVGRRELPGHKVHMEIGGPLYKAYIEAFEERREFYERAFVDGEYREVWAAVTQVDSGPDGRVVVTVTPLRLVEPT